MKRPLIIVICLGVTVSVIILGISLYRASTGYQLFQRAFDGKASATCTLIEPGETVLEKTEIYFGDDRIKLIHQYNREGSEGMTINTLVNSGSEHSWMEGAKEGTVRTLSGSVKDYFNNELPDKDTFEELQGTCDRGTPVDSFKVPDDITFIEDQPDTYPLQ